MDDVGVHLLGDGRPGNPGQICTIAQPCAIPSNIGQGVSVPAGTPFVTKQADGTYSTNRINVGRDERERN